MEITPATYVTGHRNPDTDSIVAAISYANLCNALGETGYVPARLGHLNDESMFLLNKFGFQPPLYLHTVRTQVKDIEFDQLVQVGLNAPVSHVWQLMYEKQRNKIAQVVNEDGTLYGVVSVGDIAEQDMHSIREPHVENVPVFNLLSAIEGTIINSDENVFENLTGDVVIALPGPEENVRDVKEGSIVICGEQENVAEKALEKQAACIIFCQCTLAEKYRGRNTKTCLITTPCDAYMTSRMIYQSIPVSRIITPHPMVCFHLEDYLDDVKETILQSRYRSYPVLDENDHVVGSLSRYHLMQPKRKKVFLVDHNEIGQSVPGLDQAELVGIIDHHRLADVQTGYPVFMRNEPVGSSVTIIATMYQEQGLTPGANLAGLMAAAIISDTVMFKSPTATPRDRRIAERLARIAGLDLETLGTEVFSASQSADKPAESLLFSDFKEFLISEHKLGIGQITSMDSESLIRRTDEFLEVMETEKEKKDYDFILLMITDVLREGTELLIAGDDDILIQAFGVPKVENHRAFLPHVVSRKKQVVPALSALWG